MSSSAFLCEEGEEGWAYHDADDPSSSGDGSHKKQLTAFRSRGITTVRQEQMHGVQTCDMLPVDGKDNNQHHYEEKQYEPDPSLFGCDHEGASLSCWKSALERSK